MLRHCLKAGIREGDLACRFGGESLVLSLPECNKKTRSCVPMPCGQAAEHAMYAAKRAGRNRIVAAN